MVLQQQSTEQRQQIAAALAAGHLSIPDEHGFHHGFYAVCPRDGIHVHPVQVTWRRDATGRHIDGVTCRCHACGVAWQPSIDELRLY